MLSKLWNSSRPGDARRAFDCDFLKRFRKDTLDFHYADDAVLPPALEKKLTLVE